MPEFKKKTALGLRDLPEYGQECTHVLLTHSEYDGLLAKVACAERDARSVYTAASQKIAQAERNSAQAKEAAYAEVDAVQKDLEEACRKIEYLNGLNKNLLRIARERSNADRKLRPKKTHTGYVVLASSEKEYRYKTMRKETAVAGLWETALQSPYSVDFTEEQARALTEELVQPNENRQPPESRRCSRIIPQQTLLAASTAQLPTTSLTKKLLLLQTVLGWFPSSMTPVLYRMILQTKLLLLPILEM